MAISNASSLIHEFHDNAYNYSTIIDLIKRMETSKKRTYAMSMHTGFKQCDFTKLETIHSIKFTGALYHLTFVNNQGIERKISCDVNSQVYSKNMGFISVNRLKLNHLIIDESGHINKLKSSVVEEVTDATLYDVHTAFNRNVFCNGILIR